MRFFGDSGKRQNRVEPRFTAASPENPSTSLSNPDAWFMDWATDGANNFGPPVSEQTSMAVSTVFACVSLIAGLIAGLPLNIYRDEPDGGREESPDHRLSDLLGSCPYPGRSLTSFVWREQWSINTSLWGNHYSIIRFDGAGRVMGFEPVPPWNVEVIRQVGVNFYRCRLENGDIETVPAEDMLHIPGVGFDGIKGQSRIKAFARNAIGLAKTMEQQIGMVHENAAKPSGMVSVAPGVSADGLKRQKAFFEAQNTGRANAGKVLFADAGSVYTPLQMTPEDLNTLAFRQYQSADICRFFGVPPHLVGENSGTSVWGTGIEQNTKAFLIFKMEAELQRIEHELNMKLLSKGPFYAQFDREALLAMDALVAAQVAQTRINSGLLTPNEGRRKLNLPAMPEGNELMVNSTMIPLSRAIKPPPPPPAPVTTPEPDKPAPKDDP